MTYRINNDYAHRQSGAVLREMAELLSPDHTVILRDDWEEGWVYVAVSRPDLPNVQVCVQVSVYDGPPQLCFALTRQRMQTESTRDRLAGTWFNAGWRTVKGNQVTAESLAATVKRILI